MFPFSVGIAVSAVLAIGGLLVTSLGAQTPTVTTVGTACGGAGSAAVFRNLSLPIPGSMLRLRAENLPPNGIGALFVAERGYSIGGRVTPLPLGPYGMPGCNLHPHLDQTYVFGTGDGTAQWNLWLPPSQRLLGASAWAQAFFVQRGLNAAQMGTTNALVVDIGSPNNAPRRSSISQWGITWTFDREYPAGQFCNGDWWVVGPVTVVSISPPTQTVSGRVINGSMINPPLDGDQGYDSTLYGQFRPQAYKNNLNVARNLPRTIQPSSSLVSTISQIGPAANGSASQLQTAAVLTVLGAVPPPDAFRPPYTGTDKSIRHRERDLDYSVLANLAPASGAPSPTAIAPRFERVWLDHYGSWLSRYLHPAQNMPDYYRDFTALYGSGALLLNCDFGRTQKRDLLVWMTQVGLDHYGNMLNGIRWGVNGHCNGRKFPILFAGRVLNDIAMLSVGTAWRTVFRGPGHPQNNVAPFSEDGQTFYVEETSPGVFNWGHGNYNASHRGMAEWGNSHTENTASDNSAWNSNPYRVCCSANGWVGQTLAMRIMGLRSAWNQPAYFDYMDRYKAIEPPGWTQSWEPWHAAMWAMYRPRY